MQPSSFTELPITELQIEPKDLAVLRRELARLAAGLEIWVYGSRTYGQARRWSDIDLAVVNPPQEDPHFVSHLGDEIAEGPLMLRADVVDLTQVSADFRKIIEDHHIVVQAASQRPISAITA